MAADPRMTRRTLLRAGAGAAVTTGLSATPATRALARAAALRRPGSRPFPGAPAGREFLHQIEHVVVLMLENHSFDNILGALPHRVPARRGVDGLRFAHGRAVNGNRDAHGRLVRASLAPSPCQLVGLPGQDWNRSHVSYAHGHNDGFVRASGPSAMWYWDDRDLPVTYALASRFPIGERYFQSCLAQTYPNRRFLFAATATGTIATTNKDIGRYAPRNGTIFDRLDRYGISWRDYAEKVPSPLIMPQVLHSSSQLKKLEPIERFYAAAEAGRLPHVSFVEPDFGTTSEENPQDIQVGERFLRKVVEALFHSPNWGRTALFVTYDEHGGYYDHVPPPRAIRPDGVAPRLAPDNLPGGYDRYGFRVPMIVVSPWAKAHHVSRVVQDHTSILAFIERKWNLPALTWRDANADPMLDYFNFRRRTFAHPPKLPAAPALAPGLRRCAARGLHPPLPPGTKPAP